MTTNIQEHLKSLNMVYLALIGGQIMFCLILLFLNTEGDTAATSTYLYIGPLITIASIIAAFALYGAHKKQAKEITDLEEKLSHHRQTNILRWALLEGGNLINLIFFFLEGNYIYLLFFSVGLITFLAFRPTEQKIKEEYSS